jgi:Pectate lyase superfamily protein
LKRLLALALILISAAAFAQVPNWPQTLPANTVVGRLGTGSGPAQAIPFATFTTALLANTFSGDCTLTGTVFTCTKTNGVAFATSATTDATNASNITTGSLPVAQLSPLFANNNAWTGTNAFKGPAQFSGKPWADVTSGANSCAAAVGNGSNDDTAAIQCQITYMNATYAGGLVFFPPGNYKTTSTITVPAGVILQGAGINATLLGSITADIVVLEFTGQYAGLRDMGVAGYTNSAATKSTIIVDANVLQTNFKDCNITGGLWALEQRGADGVVQSCYVQGYGTAGGNLYSYGGRNWYLRAKFDDNGQAHAYGVLIKQGSTVGALENSFDECDFSGNFTTASLKIDDGTASTAQTTITNSTFSSAVILTDQLFTLIAASKFSANLTLSAGGATIASSHGASIAATGATCSANIGITC